MKLDINKFNDIKVILNKSNHFAVTWHMVFEVGEVVRVAFFFKNILYLNKNLFVCEGPGWLIELGSWIT